MTMETVSEAVARLERRGYKDQFVAEGGRIRCQRCESWHHGGDMGLDEVARFEGASDPDDEAAVFALTCGHCGAKGTYTTAFGPAMTADDAELVRQLVDRRGRR